MLQSTSVIDKDICESHAYSAGTYVYRVLHCHGQVAIPLLG